MFVKIILGSVVEESLVLNLVAGLTIEGCCRSQLWIDERLWNLFGNIAIMYHS